MVQEIYVSFVSGNGLLTRQQSIILINVSLEYRRVYAPIGLGG